MATTRRPATVRPVPAGERLRVSPAFVQAFTLDGRPYIAKETEPYEQYWLSERYRALLGAFGGRRGATVDEALAACARLAGATPDEAWARPWRRAVADMRRAGVLVGAADDPSRYTAAIVDAYVRHRPFPPEIVQHLVAAAGIGADSAVLDLAGGPGDLALALARTSGQVSMMELSKGFVAAARRRARAQGLPLTPLHDSANRLQWRDESYDTVTVSQALHWLDDVMVCRGVCRVLRPDGSFFVIHSAIDLPDAHPLAYLLGHDSILGAKPRQRFADEVAPLQRRLALLFEALDAPEVQRIDPTRPQATAQRIVPAGVALFRQRRPFGLGYARGFLTDQHIAVTGQAPADFWRDAQARCAAVPADRLDGTHHWAVLHFQRRAAAPRLPPLRRLAVREIAWDGPAAP